MSYQHTQPTYTVQEAFEALKVSRPTGYELINAGTLESYRVGRRRFISAEQLDRCIKRLSREAA